MKKNILKIVFVIAIFTASYGLYFLWKDPYYFVKLPKSVQKIKTAKWERYIRNYLVSKAGKDYFEDHFELLETQYVSGGVYGPIFVSENLYQKYKFLPFSEKYNYEVKITYYINSKEIKDDLPPCIFEKSPDRCTFPVSYSQAYEIALERLEAPNITLKLVSIDENYKWSATKTVGDPACGAEYTSFTVDPYNASESQIQKRKSNYCI